MRRAAPPLSRSQFHPRFLFNDTATTDIYTLSLHDALPICQTETVRLRRRFPSHQTEAVRWLSGQTEDRKSTRLNSSHVEISYAVFCLKKKQMRALPVTACGAICFNFSHELLCVRPSSISSS